jgi:YaiO family outer membrane protein
MLSRSALLLVLLLLGASIVLAQTHDQAAQQAVRDHRFAQAREIYETLFKRKPSDLEYLIWIARLSGWLGDYGQAIDTYDQALARDPGNADALIGKAYVLMWQGRLAAALPILQRARTAAPDDLDVVEAWRAYEQYSLPAKPINTSQSHEEQAAAAAIRAQNFAQGRELYRKLAAEYPNNLDYVIEEARVTGWMGDYDGSMRIFDGVLAAHPDDVETMVGKAQVLLWQGRFNQAGALLKRAERLAPNNPEVALVLARFYFYQDNTGEAHRYLKQVLLTDPHNTDALALLALLASNHPWMLQLGFENDHFSYSAPGYIGRTTAGYEGRNTSFYLNQEVWNWYGKVDNRFGASIVHRFPTRTWLRAGLLYGPGDTVLPREDYNLGVSQQLPFGFVPSLDYRYLHFSGSNVNFIEPGIEYYFTRPIWLRLVFVETLTQFTKPAGHTGGIVPMQSVMARYNQQIAERLTVHAGYAYGGETFLPYTYDRVGRFYANTALAGADLSISPLYKVGVWYGCEIRNDNRTLSSVTLTFTVRR